MIISCLKSPKENICSILTIIIQTHRLCKGVVPQHGRRGVVVLTPVNYHHDRKRQSLVGRKKGRPLVEKNKNIVFLDFKLSIYGMRVPLLETPARCLQHWTGTRTEWWTSPPWPIPLPAGPIAWSSSRTAARIKRWGMPDTPRCIIHRADTITIRSVLLGLLSAMEESRSKILWGHGLFLYSHQKTKSQDIGITEYRLALLLEHECTVGIWTSWKNTIQHLHDSHVLSSTTKQLNLKNPRNTSFTVYDCEKKRTDQWRLRECNCTEESERQLWSYRIYRPKNTSSNTRPLHISGTFDSLSRMPAVLFFPWLREAVTICRGDHFSVEIWLLCSWAVVQATKQCLMMTEPLNEAARMTFELNVNE